MRAFALPLPVVFLLLSACDGGTGKGTDGDGSGSDSGDTADSGLPDSGGDTGQPGSVGGYQGPPAIFVVAGNFVTGNADEAKVFLYDPGSAALTEVPDLTVRADSLVGCAGAFAWVMQSQSSEFVGDTVHAVDVASLSAVASIDLGSFFGPTAVAAVGDNYTFGGAGSASLMTVALDGTLVSSEDLSAYADSDGLPEVVAISQGPAGTAAVLGRRTVTNGSYEASAVVSLDAISGEVTGSGGLSGKNAGRVAAQGPGGLLVALDRTVSGTTWNEDGGIEQFDVTTMTSVGTLVDFAGVDRIATVIGAWDASIAIAAREDSGAVTITRYGPDGSVVGSFPAFTATNGLALTSDGFASGEGAGSTAQLVFRTTDGIQTGDVVVGADIRSVTSCLPPPPPPDDGGGGGEGGGEGGDSGEPPQ
jgi:hypothetical protein